MFAQPLDFCTNVLESPYRGSALNGLIRHGKLLGKPNHLTSHFGHSRSLSWFFVPTIIDQTQEIVGETPVLQKTRAVGEATFEDVLDDHSSITWGAICDRLRVTANRQLTST